MHSAKVKRHDLLPLNSQACLLNIHEGRSTCLVSREDAKNAKKSNVQQWRVEQ